MRLKGTTDVDKTAVDLGDLAKLGWSSFVGEFSQQLEQKCRQNLRKFPFLQYKNDINND
jgi:hypothetical protein